MKFDFSKSSPDLQNKLSIQLEAIQSELRWERSEHSVMLRKLNMILNDLHLQDQVTSHYKKYGEDETSPQTELDEHE